MKKSITPFIGLYAFSILLTNCKSNDVMESKSVSQDEIHQSYYITLNEEDGILNVNADFRVAGPTGTTLVLSEPSDATCNGDEMKLETYLLGGAHYVYNKKVEDISDKITINLAFSDTEKQPYKNQVYMGTMHFAGNISALKKDSMNLIQVQYSALLNNESAKLNIHGDSSSVEIPINKQIIEISPDNLKEFRKGEEIILQISINRTGNIQYATPRGGTFETNYNSIKKKTVIR